MQKGGILNSHIAKVLADLGHTDTICIGDCGLPVPAGVQKIDLALTFGSACLKSQYAGRINSYCLPYGRNESP